MNTGSSAKPLAASNRDLEFSGAADIPPLIPEGKYEVVFLYAKKKWLWGREKVFLHFQIVTPGEFHGIQLYMVCNVKPSKRKWGASSKFYDTWVLAAGKRPDRFDRMSTRVFQGSVFLAQIRTVKTNSRHMSRSSLLQYSIIDVLLDRLTNSSEGS